MKIVRRIVLLLACLLVIAQFVRPTKNTPAAGQINTFTGHYAVPADVEAILRTACYDCHSDSTRYPWYAEVQPMGWWLNNHIQDGKRHLNFSGFAEYRLRRQYGKFGDIVSEVSDGGMPLPSYLIVHTDARLSKEQQDRIVGWAKAMQDTMKAHYPADSLERKTR